MKRITLRRRLLAGCSAAGVAVVLGFSGALTGVAVADPVLPAPPLPGYPPAYAPPAYAPPAQARVPQGGISPQAAATGPAASPQVAESPIPAAGVAPGQPEVVPPMSAPSTLVPATAGTLRDYFADKGVKLEPQVAAGFNALDITLPVPTGWTQVPDPNVPDAFAVIANRRSGALYAPNAQVVVYRLVGQFDPREAITHGFIDSQKLPAWQTTNASLAEFGGFPSSAIEGTYRQNDMTLNTSQRHVIAGSRSGNYLVSLTVTTGVTESVAHGPATDAIVNGFAVAAPGTAQPGAATPPGAVTPPAASPAPAAAPAPTALSGTTPGSAALPAPVPMPRG